MARLKLLDLRCIKTEEMGDDEPYLKVNGSRVWKSDSMEAGDVASLRSIQMIPFQGHIQLELWEADTTGDDHLGTTVIYENAAWQGELEFMFDQGAKYLLIYEVFG